MKKKLKQSLQLESLRANASSLLSSVLTPITALVGSIKTYVVDWNNSRVVYLPKNPQGSCFSCLRDTVSQHWHQWRSQLGIWVETQTTNLYLARTRVRLRWDLAVRSVSYFVNQHIKQPFVHVWTQIRSLPKLGLLLAAVVLLLLVWAVV